MMINHCPLWSSLPSHYHNVIATTIKSPPLSKLNSNHILNCVWKKNHIKNIGIKLACMSRLKNLANMLKVPLVHVSKRKSEFWSNRNGSIIPDSEFWSSLNGFIILDSSCHLNHFHIMLVKHRNKLQLRRAPRALTSICRYISMRGLPPVVKIGISQIDAYLEKL